MVIKPYPVEGIILRPYVPVSATRNGAMNQRLRYAHQIIRITGPRSTKLREL